MMNVMLKQNQQQSLRCQQCCSYIQYLKCLPRLLKHGVLFLYLYELHDLRHHINGLMLFLLELYRYQSTRRCLILIFQIYSNSIQTLAYTELKYLKYFIQISLILLCRLPEYQTTRQFLRLIIKHGEVLMKTVFSLVVQYAVYCSAKGPQPLISLVT